MESWKLSFLQYLWHSFELFHRFKKPTQLQQLLAGTVLTTIDFTVGTQCIVSLQIHDLRGRLVQTLLHQTLTPVRYSVNWDGASYPRGCILSRWKVVHSHKHRRHYCLNENQIVQRSFQVVARGQQTKSMLYSSGVNWFRALVFADGHKHFCVSFRPNDAKNDIFCSEGTDIFRPWPRGFPKVS